MSEENSYTIAEVVRLLEGLKSEVERLRADMRDDMKRLEAQYVTRAELDAYKELQEGRWVAMGKQVEEQKPERIGRAAIIGLVISGIAAFAGVAMFAASFINWVAK